ncbi:RNA polymerase sigma factor [Salidesulfovibrio onnuriiensis]|uniref:RNA polymerase sigma factor n=1 Tax=Salidesulfovibrio onnuriiensis TaxID=2583823 RepID=UPI0011CBA911|nr:RNA polymerase sigma factor [Salidesulfovibrio onnuriiensis]
MKGKQLSPDTAVVQEILEGNVNAFETLVNRHQEHVSRIVGNHVPYQRVDEVVQAAFVNAYRSLNTFRGEKPFRNWLSKISVRCCYDFWREEYRYRETPVSTLGADPWDMLDRLTANQAQEEFLAQAQQEENIKLLDWALDQLSPEDRMVVTLTALEEKSVAEAAHLLGWTKVNVKVRAHRARNKLKKILKQAI